MIEYDKAQSLNPTPIETVSKVIKLTDISKPGADNLADDMSPAEDESSIDYEAEFMAEAARTDAVPTEPIGIFHAKSFNQAIADARSVPNPTELYHSLWYEGELCCLFSDSNLGKSILAVQIAANVAETGKRVACFDLEQSEKQFQMRYTTEDGVSFHFPENLIRVEIDSDSLTEERFEDVILKYIEATIVRVNIDVAIIDNLTWICAETEKGDKSARLMVELKKLRAKYDISMLIVAHTPKRDMSRPITANDLAGSRKLYNFFDSVFAIGRSAQDSNLRYIKQIKCRQGEFVYDAENVIVCSIVKGEDGFLHFEHIGCASEREHLREPTDCDRSALETQVRALYGQGKSYRKIADELGISHAKVQRILNKSVVLIWLLLAGVSGVSVRYSDTAIQIEAVREGGAYEC